LRDHELTPQDRHFRSMPKMTTNEISDNLRDKSFHKTATDIRKRTEVEQLNLETHWTDFLQSLVDFGNKHYRSRQIE
jgi:hypothetical protein